MNPLAMFRSASLTQDDVPKCKKKSFYQMFDVGLLFDD